MIFLFTKILILSNQRSTALFKTNKNVNLLGMSTAQKRLCVFSPFFSRWKINTWIIVVLLWYIKSLTLGLSYKPKGTHLKMGYRYVWPRRPTFHALLAVCKTPRISPCFSSQDSTFSLKSQISRNFKLLKSPKPKNWGNIQFGNLKLGQNQFTRLQFVRYSVQKGPRLSSGQFTYKPLWCPSGCTTILPKWKLSATGPGVSRLQEFILAQVFAKFLKNVHPSVWYKSGKKAVTGCGLEKKRGSLGVRLE